MPRSMPEYPGPITINNSFPGMVISDPYEIEVITPIFGGGAETKKVDSEIPIRPSSIRGHLRFWWRATRGAHLSVDALRAREEEIWGSSKSPSPVIIEVGQPSIDSDLDIKTVRALDIRQSDPAGYALFSAEREPGSDPLIS